MLINDNQPMQKGSASGPQQIQDDGEDEDGEEHFGGDDEIGDIDDYDDLDPQILELAQ